ncbi:hypothetical protein QJS10_CPB11g00984 [Acorus calamus]|uniref:Uncharacterized protein n=1 Tax=Acorus calamus TaxID=4465 RepID=A0AAV9DUE1_ACOCL|nr:hypothetical protein QJS10_CPB11g00984 [Acorus calamus]
MRLSVTLDEVVARICKGALQYGLRLHARVLEGGEVGEDDTKDLFHDVRNSFRKREVGDYENYLMPEMINGIDKVTSESTLWKLKFFVKGEPEAQNPVFSHLVYNYSTGIRGVKYTTKNMLFNQEFVVINEGLWEAGVALQHQVGGGVGGKSSPVRITEVSVVKVALEVEVRKLLIFVMGQKRGSCGSYVAAMTVKMRTPRTKRAK